jgi:HAD superfamily hydrolase (TIGR01549 family)
MPVKAVLFDMFDTLMLIEKNHEFYSPSLMRMYRYLASKGVEVPFEKFNNTYIEIRDGLYRKADLNWEEPHFNVRVAQTLQKLGYNYDISHSIVGEATSEFCDEFMKYVHIDSDAASVLEKLYGKYRLGIISNFAIPECVHKLLQTVGIEQFFDVIVVSAAVNKRKPALEIFESTLKIMGFSASEVVFVGDTIDADVEGSKAAGMKAIYIKRRPQKQSDRFLPDCTIESLSELPSALKNY